MPLAGPGSKGPPGSWHLRHPQELLVPGRAWRSSGLALPLSVMGRWSWGKADLQPHPPPDPEKGGLEGPVQVPVGSPSFPAWRWGFTLCWGTNAHTYVCRGAALGPGLPLVNEWRSLIALKPLLLSRPRPPPLLLPTLAE